MAESKRSEQEPEEQGFVLRADPTSVLLELGSCSRGPAEDAPLMFAFGETAELRIGQGWGLREGWEISCSMGAIGSHEPKVAARRARNYARIAELGQLSELLISAGITEAERISAALRDSLEGSGWESMLSAELGDRFEEPEERRSQNETYAPSEMDLAQRQES